MHLSFLYFLASGEFFWIKLVVMEVLEISLQVQSLATSATNSQVDEVSLSAWIIAANFIVLPLAILVGPWMCSSSSHASSHHIVMATVMVIEVLFDKLYVAIGVLLRPDTMIDRKLDLMGQLAVHGALLLPALMTALDVQDALDLSDHMDTLLETTSRSRSRSTIVHNISSKMDRVTHHPVFIMMQRAGLAVSILLGLAFGTYTQYSVVTAKQECVEKIGSIAKCADKKYYFANGFFEKTTCAFDQVEKFNCSAERGETIINFDSRMLDAEEEYASMSSLTHIIMQNSLLESAPRGWAKVPSKLTIDLTNSKQFSGLPFVLCAFGTNLTKITLDGTSAENALNWTGQLRAANMSTSNDYLNAACREELERLQNFTTLLLGDNELKDEDLKDDGRLALSSFNKLTRLDVENNQLEVVNINVNEKVYRPIVERFVSKKDESSGISVSFAGNPLLSWQIVAGGKKYKEEWANVMMTSTAVENDINVVVSDWGATEITKLTLLLPDLNVQKLLLFNNKFGDKGAKAIAAALPNSKVTVLYLKDNKIRDEGAKALAEALPNSKVTEFRLDSNQIGDEGAKAIAAALPNSKLTRINLDRNQIGDEGAKALAAALPNSKVTRIDLDRNQIGDEGAKAIAAALPNSKVTVLYLNDNKIGDEAAKALAAALPNSKVTRINLESNQIGDEGAKAIAAALPNSKLTWIHLSSNQIGDEGAKALRSGFFNSDGTRIHIIL